MLTARQLWEVSEEDRKIEAKAVLLRANDDSRQAEAAKTSQLRTLRLTKEAGEKDAADRKAAVKASNSKSAR